MIRIKTLEHTPKKEIYECFKESFAHYVIPLEFDETMTMTRWKLAEVDYKLSYGAFDDEKLVAFILHLPGPDHLFNFGTGVLISHRGQRLVQKMYEAIETEIKSFHRYSLECIKENIKALTIYQKLGFEIKRELVSLQGNLHINAEVNKGHRYSLKPLSYTPELDAIRLYEPSMESSAAILQKHPDHYELHELRKDGKLLAYAIYHPAVTSLKEVGAMEPLAQNLDQLFLAMKMNKEKLRVMNIDHKAREFISYLCDRDLKIFVTQYEMFKEKR